MNSSIVATSLLCASLCLIGCNKKAEHEEAPMESAGQELEETASEVSEGTEEPAAETGEAPEEAGDGAEEATD